MSAPILYLHGVGEKVRAGAWFAALNLALAAHGGPARRLREDLLVPDYVDLLRQGRRLPLTAPPPSTFDAERAGRARAAFMRERGRLAETLAQTLGPDRRRGPAVPGVVYETGRHTWGMVSRSMRHVEHYRRHPALRHEVLHRVLGTLETHLRERPETREVVVVAHSLGALVALDLLPHLPAGLRVHRLVTLGSPAGWPSLHRGTDRAAPDGEDRFPYDRVGSWVNLHSPRDLVPLGRGSAALFPAAVDVRTVLAPARHGAEFYVRAPVFGQVLADALGLRTPTPGAPA